MNPNRKAFLDMIATSEGTIHLGDNGYNVVVGGTLFNSYDDHPRQVIHLNPKLSSSAAGRYQLLARYYDSYKKSLDLPDFSPDSQDQIALQQCRERNSLIDIDEGRFDIAVKKCSNIWASLPGNNYGQHQNTIEYLRKAYEQAGGTLA